MPRAPAALLAVCWAFSSAALQSPWNPLFNGKDLSGWRAHGAEKWVVEYATLGQTSAEALAWMLLVLAKG